MTSEQLRAWRSAHRLSLSQLAEALGVNRQSLWRYEHPEAATGRPVPPYLERALRDLERELVESPCSAAARPDDAPRQRAGEAPGYARRTHYEEREHPI